MVVTIIGSFLLGYLCYYIVSCYIRLIILNVERPQRLLGVKMLVEKVSETRKSAWYTFRYSIIFIFANISWFSCSNYSFITARINRRIPVKETRKQKLKNSKRMFGYLCEALIELNQVFSLPVLVFLTLRLISTAFSLYVAINGLVNANNLTFRALVPAFATISAVGLFSILIVFRAADLPIIQVRDEENIALNKYDWSNNFPNRCENFARGSLVF